MPTGRGYELVGRGSDMALRVWGADLLACLAAAVEGFAGALADVDPALPRRRTPLAVAGAAPEGLLIDLLDELILRLDADGDLAVALTDATVTEGGLRAVLETVDLGALEVHGAAPKAATWHGVRLGPTGDGWRGEIMLDL